MRCNVEISDGLSEELTRISEHLGLTFEEVIIYCLEMVAFSLGPEDRERISEEMKQA